MEVSALYSWFNMSGMLWVSEALTPCCWSGKISVSPENYSLAVSEGSVTVSCVRASPEVSLCSICKIHHTLTHTCINTCTPKKRLLPGRTGYLGCYRAGSSQHPLGGASALQYSQTGCCGTYPPKEALNVVYSYTTRGSWAVLKNWSPKHYYLLHSKH